MHNGEFTYSCDCKFLKTFDTGYARVNEGDWGYYHNIKEMADRIVSDWRFDEQCRKAIINRTRLKMMKG